MFLHSLHRWSCHLQQKFISSFQNCITFISFSHPITLVRTLSTGLKTVVRGKYPYLVPDLSGKTLVFTWKLNMMLAVEFLLTFFMKLRKFPSLQRFAESFHHEWALDFLPCFSASTDGWYFFFSFLMWWITLIFQMKSLEIHTYDKLHLILVYNSFCMLVNSVCSYFFLRIFTSVFMRNIGYHNFLVKLSHFGSGVMLAS